MLRYTDCKTIMSECEEAARVYYECMTTDKYGQTYLDPAKCEAHNFDPIRVCKEQYLRHRLISKYCDDIGNMYDWPESDKLIVSLIPDKYKKYQTRRSSGASYIPKQAHKRVEKRSENKLISSVSKATQRILPKKVQKRTEKQSKSEPISMLCKAAQLVGRDVKIGDTYAKVVTHKMTEHSVMLEVKEDVEEDVWDQYDIEYNTDMEPL
ncbi:uncharacterized protein VTP21DRAFT_3520 [Calcarisporiella thermophila]|uniref:uncharacterized protein n=1 Tax=Calcarisporiella thermophila TaxID=911321 RepID=UPI0037441216